jgi:hypothetical protein
VHARASTIDKAEVAATLRPLADASTLAPRFYVDPRICALEVAPQSRT